MKDVVSINVNSNNNLNGILQLSRVKLFKFSQVVH